uniref:Uncharacterized protein n=1 Tax=Romanomermis culicivorax TaxID=13658 RepID=A0A915ITD4_ROMCU
MMIENMDEQDTIKPCQGPFHQDMQEFMEIEVVRPCWWVEDTPRLSAYKVVNTMIVNLQYLPSATIKINNYEKCPPDKQNIFDG